MRFLILFLTLHFGNLATGQMLLHHTRTKTKARLIKLFFENKDYDEYYINIQSNSGSGQFKMTEPRELNWCLISECTEKWSNGELVRKLEDCQFRNNDLAILIVQGRDSMSIKIEGLPPNHFRLKGLVFEPGNYYINLRKKRQQNSSQLFIQNWKNYRIKKEQ